MIRFARALPLVAALVIAAPIAFGIPASAAVPTAAKPKVTASGFTFVPTDPGSTFAGDVTAAAVVENPTEKVAVDVVVTLTLEDQRKRVITDSEFHLSYVAPGDEAYAIWDTTYPETKVPVALTAKVTSVGELMSARAWAQDAQYSLGVGEFGADQPIPIEDVAVEFSDLRYHDSTTDTAASGLASSIVGTARSVAGEELTGLDVTCAAFENGDVTGGGHVVLPIIPEGGEAGIQASGLLGGLAPDELRCSGRVEYLRARVGTLDDALVVADAGFSLTSIEEYTMGAVIENPTDKWAWGLDVAFDVLDADGRVIGSRTASEPIYVAPQSVVYVAPGLPGAPNEFAGAPTQLRVLVTAGVFHKPGRAIKDEAGFDPAAWKFEFTDLSLDDSGHVTGTIVSRSKKPLDALDISCGLFRGEAIVGAASSTVDESELGGPLEPGKPAKFEVGVALDSASADSFGCVGTITGLSDV
jgi:hypothetical protein